MSGLTFGTVCSGIEAATQAWAPLGWMAKFYSEIDPFARAVLQHHHKDTPLHGDFTTIGSGEYGAIDVLGGGTPCQSYSVAGKRGGLDDPRGELSLEYCALAKRLRPRWLVWENVPGVLSSSGGRDFATFLRALAECGYGWAYRVLDAQYFGLAQRRKRVILVGHAGGCWQRAAAVLFEREGMRWDPPPSREAWQGIAPTLSARTEGGGGLGTDFDLGGGLQVFGGNNCSGEIDVAPALAAHGGPHGRQNFASEAFVCEPIAFSAKDHGADAEHGLSPTLRAGGHAGSHANAGVMPAVAFDLRGREDGAQMEGPHDTANIRAASGGSSRSYVAFDTTQITDPRNGSNPQPDSAWHALSARAHPPAIASPWAVRRLTPRECERLQGFPDNHTRIPRRGKPAELCPDGPRYKALGNSWAVPKFRWVGARIQFVDGLEVAP